MKAFKTVVAALLVLCLIGLGLTTVAFHDSNKAARNELGQLQQKNTELTKEKEQFQKQIADLQSNATDLEKQISDLKSENSNLKSKQTGMKPVSYNGASDTPGDKTVYLTFDDGPSKNTPQILDILKQYKAKATFFVIANNTELGKSMYKRIVDEGGVIGNHTYSHDYATVYASIDAYISQTNKLNDLIYQAAGVRPDIIRFPGGSNNHVSWQYSGKDFMPKLTDRMLKEGYQYFDWNVDSTDADAVTQNKDTIINTVMSEVSNKKAAIILFHDSNQKTTTVEALPIILERLTQMGYKFGILSKDSYSVHF